MKIFLVLGLFLAACSQTVYTPPARPSALSTPATLGRGNRTVQVSGGAHGAVFGPDLASVTAQHRVGLLDRLDLVLDGSFARVMDHSGAGENRNLFMLRGGVKQRLHQHVAVIAGAGGGFAPAGGPYLSADLALIAAIENCYVVPFVTLSGFVSVPLAPRDIDLRQNSSSEPVMDRPETTFGAGAGTGLKVPLEHKRCPVAPARVSLVVAFHATQLWSSEASDTFFTLAFGVEVRL